MTRISVPYFEIGPKNLMRLEPLGALCQVAGRAAEAHDVTVIVTVPAAFVQSIASQHSGVLVFAQHLDPDQVGPSVGTVTAEALVDVGADGVMLNHDSHPLSFEELAAAVARATECGLLTMVCANDLDEALRLAALDPTILLFEPPELIGHAGGAPRPWIEQANAEIAAVNADVLVMHAGGIATVDDVRDVISAGASGTGATSGIVRAADPHAAAWDFIGAVRDSWDAHAQQLLGAGSAD